MKLVWENGGATVQAPKNLRSAWPNSPDTTRSDFGRMYNFGTMGVWQQQAMIKEYQEEKHEENRQNLLSLLKDLVD